jgi:hypothetical protein
MQNGWIIWQLSKIKQDELLKQAEMFRLLQQSGSSRRAPNPRFCSLISRLWKRLVSWGHAGSIGLERNPSIHHGG